MTAPRVGLIMGSDSDWPVMSEAAEALAEFEVPFEVGVKAARELAELVDDDTTLAQFALRWVIDQPGVSTVIPGARNPEQVSSNVAAAELAPLRPEQLDGVRDVYDRLIREHVHDRW